VRLKGLRLGLAAFAAVISVSGVVLVATGYQLSSVRDKVEAKRIRSELSDRSSELRHLQVQWDRDRVPIKDYFAALETVLKLARTTGGDEIANARTKFASVPSLRVDAEKAVRKLPGDTAKILAEARHDIKKVKRLESITTQTDELTYLAELTKALQLFVESFVSFDKMNEPLSQGLVLYNRLSDQTQAFLDAEANGQFRSKAEATRSYTVSTSEVSAGITAVTAELAPLESEAVAKLTESKRASQRSKDLRPR
jgi:hypothetical protein